jgi:general secretion pathway protein D
LGPESAHESADGTVPMSRLIAIVAKKTGKKFIVEPRVHADVVLVGQDPSAITYGDFLAILQIYGFAAVEGGGYVRVVPDALVRVMALPQVSGRESHPDAEYVTKIIPVKNMPAGTLVPILRGLLPQNAHLAAAICSNTLIMVDTFANVRRIEALVQSVDTGQPYKPPEKCEMRELAPPREAPVKREG